LSAFDQMEARLAADFMRHFGSTITIVPMRSRPNKPAVLDASRKKVTLCGAVYAVHRLSDMDKNSRIDRANKTKSMSFNNVSTSDIKVTVNVCDLETEPRQHDAVIREGVSQAYEITDVRRNGQSSIDLILSEVEGPFPVSY